MSFVVKTLEIILIMCVFVIISYWSNQLGNWLFTKKRNRGFEQITKFQWTKDLRNVIRGYGIRFKKGELNYYKLKLPKRATTNSAGYDVFSPFSFILNCGESINIPTGFKSYMNKNEKLVFHPRSGLGFKFFVRLANTTGIGDSDYFDNIDNEGHYWIKIRNEGSKILSVNKGDAIAQCIFEDYKLADGDSHKGKARIGGFGSTG